MFSTTSFVLFSLQDIYSVFRYVHISNDCNVVIFLVVIVHVSHPSIKGSTTSCFHNCASCSYSFQHIIEITSCNFNYFQYLIIAFSIRYYSLSKTGICVTLFYDITIHFQNNFGQIYIFENYHTFSRLCNTFHIKRFSKAVHFIQFVLLCFSQ